jgi:putative oxidoreductase
VGIGRLAVRALVGGLFIGHGTQKLFGWFGGPGIAGATGFMESLDMRPGRQNAYAAGISEAGGGALLALGAATPLAAAMLTGTMVTAIRKVHAKNGVWASGGGWEYNAVLIAAVTALADVGPGGFSIDGALGREWTGTKAALFALLLGAAASTAAIELGKRASVAAAPTTASADAGAGEAAGGSAGEPITTDS